jgi:PIN domain nuclease of toxin-antitoxin system
LPGTSWKPCSKSRHFAIRRAKCEHAAASGHLKTVHADPFDRLLIAQAVTEPLILITRDSKVAGYSPTFITW